MLEDYPRQLPHTSDIILNSNNQEFIMKQGVSTLVIWPISGIPLHHEEFLHKLWNYSSHHGETKPTAATTHYLQNGLTGMSKGVEIPLLDL